MARVRRAGLVLLAAAGGVSATPALAQSTSTTTESSPLYTVTVPAKATPTPSVTPSSSSGGGGGSVSSGTASAPPAALPSRLASTGTDPLLIIAAGLGVLALSLAARRVIRARIGEG
jgi:hypothetical protein